jgi:hypothetical protein
MPTRTPLDRKERFMFTVLAIILTIIGIFLFTLGNRDVDDFKWYNNLGAYMLIIACVLWAVVFIALVWWGIAWLWQYAP